MVGPRGRIVVAVGVGGGVVVVLLVGPRGGVYQLLMPAGTPLLAARHVCLRLVRSDPFCSVLFCSRAPFSCFVPFVGAKKIRRGGNATRVGSAPHAPIDDSSSAVAIDAGTCTRKKKRGIVCVVPCQPSLSSSLVGGRFCLVLFWSNER